MDIGQPPISRSVEQMAQIIPTEFAGHEQVGEIYKKFSSWRYRNSQRSFPSSSQLANSQGSHSEGTSWIYDVKRKSIHKLALLVAADTEEQHSPWVDVQA